MRAFLGRAFTLFFALSISFLGGDSTAATVSWINQNGGNWSARGNWNSNVVPSSADTVTIAGEGNYTVVVDVPSSVKSFTLGGNIGVQTLRIDGATLAIEEASSVLTNGFLELITGEISGTGELRIGGNMVWSGGIISGPGVFAVLSFGKLRLEGESAKTLTSGRILKNSGSVTWVDGEIDLTPLSMAGSGQIVNQANGSFEMQSQEAISAFTLGMNLPPFPSVTFEAFGEVSKTGPAETTIRVPLLDQGTLRVLGGVLRVAESDSGRVGEPSSGKWEGNIFVAAGATFAPRTFYFWSNSVTGPGLVLFDGGVQSFITRTQIPNLALAGGIIRGVVVVTNSMLWTGGKMITAGTEIQRGATFTIDGPNTKEMGSATLHIHGDTRWLEGDIELKAQESFSGSTIIIHDDATFEARSAGAIRATGPGDLFAESWLRNAGIFRKTTTNTVEIIEVFVSGGGLFDLQEGMLKFPGDAPSPSGQFGSTLRFTFRGATPAIDFAQLQVTGNAKLNGALDLVLADDYFPLGGTEFQIIKVGGVLDAKFSAITDNAFDRGLELFTLLNPHDVTIGVKELPPRFILQADLTKLRMSGVPRKTYVLQFSTSLANGDWRPLANFQMPDAALYDYIDPDARNRPHTFYRLFRP